MIVMVRSTALICAKHRLHVWPFVHRYSAPNCLRTIPNYPFSILYIVAILLNLSTNPLSRDTGLASIESLVTTRGGFDYILLETSGLADPGNLAPLFWTDEGLGSSIYLDGIVTLVDAKNILTSLDETAVPTSSGSEGGDETGVVETAHADEHLTTAHLQISHADVVVVNKADAVTSEQLKAVVERIRSINGLAKIHITQYSQVPQLESFLLDLHAYDRVQSLESVERGHSHIDPVYQPLSTYPVSTKTTLGAKTSGQTISTIALPLPLLSESQFAALESWLRLLLWENALLPPLPPLATALQQTTLDETTALAEDEVPFSIHRTKGLIRCQDGTTKMLQGVREVFEITELEADKSSMSAGDGNEDGGGKEGKIVLIGRGLREKDVEASLARALREVGD